MLLRKYIAFETIDYKVGKMKCNVGSRLSNIYQIYDNKSINTNIHHEYELLCLYGYLFYNCLDWLYLLQKNILSNPIKSQII